METSRRNFIRASVLGPIAASFAGPICGVLGEPVPALRALTIEEMPALRHAQETAYTRLWGEMVDRAFYDQMTRVD